MLIAFPDQAEFERWALSAEYQAKSKDRIASTTATVLLVTGLRPWRNGVI